MRNFSASDWRVQRLKNYQSKLRLCRTQALNKLMLVKPENLVQEFDRICDSEFRSNNEPGISFEERKQRSQKIYNPPPEKPKPLQLKLF